MSRTPEVPSSAMVLAAGLGTRMRPLTDAMPKPLLEVAGRSLLDRTLDHLAAIGVRRAVVNLHYRGEMIRAHLAGRDDLEILFSDEQPAILDTGGGIVQALEALGDAPFFVVNSDAIWLPENPLARLAAAWRPGKMDALMLLVDRGAAVNYTRAGDFFLEASGGMPARRDGAETAPFVYTGAQILAPEAMARAPAGPFSLNLIWDQLLAKGRLAATLYPGRWVDVGTPAGLAAAGAALASVSGTPDP